MQAPVRSYSRALDLPSLFPFCSERLALAANHALTVIDCCGHSTEPSG